MNPVLDPGKASFLAIEGAFATIRRSVDAAIIRDITEFNFAIGASDTPLSPLATRAVSGGKRFRAICSYVGAAAALGSADNLAELITTTFEVPGIDDLAMAVEYYQASALTHDDVIDDSPLRRGEPSAHSSLAAQHRHDQLIGSASKYGVDGAILLGNMLAAGAENSLSRLVSKISPDRASLLLQQYSRMTGEVAQGQYRDMVAGYHPISSVDQGSESSDVVERTLQVIRVKSALYSVVRPTQLGAILAGADEGFLQVLESILEPAGLAFQLRDDELGAFGDQQTIGKPNRSDISERKHTVLLALTYANADQAARSHLERVYAADSVGESDAEETAALLERFGKQPHEELINRLVKQSQQSLKSADLSPASREILLFLVQTLTDRSV
ncbi:polyprenyl synthetase family protein [Actinomycetaceae bacterium MB13-C1-2]|nr:polyprenyl synthetase family protein [Actinomycetaceae bacterium MB13-C1-2]